MSSIKEFSHLQIQLETIASATDNFAEGNVIGKGEFVTVYEGDLLRSGEQVKIVARMLHSHIEPKERMKQFLTEISMLLNLKHENLVSIIGFCDEKNVKIIVSEHEVRGSLDEHLSSPNLKWTERLDLCVGVARGLSYIHNHTGRGYGVIHSNIKSSKILLDDKWKPKISGFGLSMVTPVTKKNHVFQSKYSGTSAYADPVYQHTRGVTHKSDVFSLGVVLFEVLCGKKAYNPDDPNGQLLAQSARCSYEKGELDQMIDPTLRKQMSEKSLNIFSEMAYNCLKEDRGERPDVDHILNGLMKALKLQKEHDDPGRPRTEDAASEELKWKHLEHLKIPFEDIKKATNNFHWEKYLGEGAYGKVYKAKLDHFDHENSAGIEEMNKCILPKKNSLVAIKSIISREDGEGEQGFSREIDMLTRCKHDNIVYLLGFCVEGPKMVLVFEYVSGGSLNEFLVKRPNFPWIQRLQMCLDIAYGLDYLHDKGIIHSDIKSDNILLNLNLVPKIADFGLSRFRPTNRSTIETIHLAGTPMYLDPEYVKTYNLKKTSDVYSFGVVLFEIVCGRVAYDSIYMTENEYGLAPIARRHSEIGTLQDIIDPKVKNERDENRLSLSKGPDEESIETFLRIASRCVAETQANRPTMKDVIAELLKALNSQKNRKDKRKVPLVDILDATENFSHECMIDAGEITHSYRAVIAVDSQNKNIVASRYHYQHGQGESDFLRHFEVLAEHKHKNIIGLLGYCDEKDERIIICEYKPKYLLVDHLNSPHITWIHRLRICIDVARGLTFLHKDAHEPIIHVSIRSGSIQLDESFNAKITGFELARICPVNQEMDYLIDTFQGSPLYSDPLYWKFGFLSKESDIYSFGVVLFEVLSGRPAYWKRYFREGTLDRITAPPFLLVQIAPRSLEIFQTIAYRCLHEERKKATNCKGDSHTTL